MLTEKVRPISTKRLSEYSWLSDTRPVGAGLLATPAGMDSRGGWRDSAAPGSSGDDDPTPGTTAQDGGSTRAADLFKQPASWSHSGRARLPPRVN
jgi:hypothetical protein